jgi:glycosyltransferase involved in cell wall biosynthesis
MEQDESPMKVWFVVMQFPVVSEAFAATEVRALRAAGASVEVLALRGTPAGARQHIERMGLGQIAVSWYSPASLLAALKFSLANPLKLLATLSWLARHAWKQPVLLLKCMVLLPRMLQIFANAARAKPDVLHLFWGHYPSVLAYMCRRWLPGTLASMSLGAYDLLYRFGPAIQATGLAHVLWTHAQVNVGFAAGCGIDTKAMKVLPRGVDWADVPVYQPSRTRTVVTVARLVEEKNTASVIRAHALVRRNFPDARLIVIGDGPQRRDLESLAASLGLTEAVSFTGAVDQSQVWSSLGTASVFVLLSVSPAERLPNSVKEAMACGCICVVSRSPGIEELMGASAGIVDAFDVQAVAARIAEVFAQPDGFEAERRSNRAVIAERFDAAQVARARVAAWREAAAAATNAGTVQG